MLLIHLCIDLLVKIYAKILMSNPFVIFLARFRSILASFEVLSDTDVYGNGVRLQEGVSDGKDKSSLIK